MGDHVDDNIKDYCSSSMTLKPDDVEDHTSYTIESWRKKTWDDGNTSYYVKLAGIKNEFRVNKTNAKKIASMYGFSMNGWVGKSITLFVDQVKSPQGGLVDSICVAVRRKQAPAKAKPMFDERNPPPADEPEFDDPIPF